MWLNDEGKRPFVAVGYPPDTFIGTYVLSPAFGGLTLGALTIALGAAVTAGTALIPALLTATALIALVPYQ